MSNRRQLARERLEFYLVQLILMYRYLIWTSGLLLLVFAIAFMLIEPGAGFSVLLLAIFLLLTSSSYRVALYTARVVAWLATLGRYDD